MRAILYRKKDLPTQMDRISKTHATHINIYQMDHVCVVYVYIYLHRIWFSDVTSDHRLVSVIDDDVT